MIADGTYVLGRGWKPAAATLSRPKRAERQAADGWTETDTETDADGYNQRLSPKDFRT